MNSGEVTVAGGGSGHDVQNRTAAAESRDIHRCVVHTLISFAFCEVTLVAAGVIFSLVMAPQGSLNSTLVLFGAVILALVLTGIVVPFLRESRAKTDSGQPHSSAG